MRFRFGRLTNINLLIYNGSHETVVRAPLASHHFLMATLKLPNTDVSPWPRSRRQNSASNELANSPRQAVVVGPAELSRCWRYPRRSHHRFVRGFSSCLAEQQPRQTGVKHKARARVPRVVHLAATARSKRLWIFKHRNTQVGAGRASLFRNRPIGSITVVWSCPRCRNAAPN